MRSCIARCGPAPPCPSPAGTGDSVEADVSTTISPRGTNRGSARSGPTSRQVLLTLDKILNVLLNCTYASYKYLRTQEEELA